MKHVMLALAVLVVFAGGSKARASCDEEDIDTVSSDGKIIELLDGSVWRVPSILRLLQRGLRLRLSWSAMMM